MFRLIGECREVGRDPRAWRVHLYEGLCKLLNAQVAVGGLGYWPKTLTSKYIEMVDIGWPSKLARQRFQDYMRDLCTTDEDLLAEGLRGPLSRHDVLIRDREEIVDDRRWYNSVLFNEYFRVSEMDHYLGSLVHLGDDLREVISLHRLLGDRPFAARERELLRLIYTEIRPSIGTSLRASGPSMYNLPARLRQVLMRLLDGDSEKQVARRLGLTPMSAHQYVKALYRHFGAASRGELMAHFVQMPAWVGEREVLF